MNFRFRLVIGLSLFALIAFVMSLRFAKQNDKTESPQSSRSKLVNGSFQPAAAHQAARQLPTPHSRDSVGREPSSLSPNPMAQVQPIDHSVDVGELTPLFQAMAKGGSFKNNPKMKALLMAAAQKPIESLALIKSAFQNTRPYETEKRTLLMSGLLEISVASRDLKTPDFDRSMDDTIEFVQQIVKDPEFVAAPIPEGSTPSQVQGMVHLGTYRFENGVLEASTWNQKLLGLGILKEASLPSTKAALEKIAKDSTLNSLVVETARQWAQ